MKPLAIQEVVLTHFKNYAEAGFRLGDRFNLISGLNGVGKTNLLDAIYYLSVAKSYFTPFDQRVVKQSESFFRLEGNLFRDPGNHKIVMKVRPGSLKEVVLDGIPLNRISDHLGFIPVVFSAPGDTDLVFGSSQYRRRYIDHLLCQVDPGYLQALATYNHLLTLRNAALKQGFNDLKRVITTYDEQMGPLATLIFEKRKWLIESFTSLFYESYRTLSENKEEVTVSYTSKLSKYPYEILADQNWESDKSTMRTNAGIHKDDYEFTIKSISAREFGSQGQIKSLIFALHLSKYSVLSEQTGYKPILILDDIFDKLDERRLHRLMDILSSTEFGQIFISDTSGSRAGEYLHSDLLTHIKM